MIKNYNIFTALDLELNQPSGRIIQIGAVVGNINTGEVLDKISIFVNPQEQLSEFIIGLTKIKQPMVDAGLSLPEAYLQLQAFHKKNGSFYNPITWGGGDTIELKAELQQSPNPPEWCFGRRWIDAKTLYVSWRLSNGKPPVGGLAKAMRNLGLQFKGCAHRADDDAENTFRIYAALLEFFKFDMTRIKIAKEITSQFMDENRELMEELVKIDPPVEE